MSQPTSTSSASGQRRVVITLGAAVLSLGLANGALGTETRNPPSGSTADEIDACVRGNFPDDSMVQSVNMVMTDRVGAERTLEAEMFWQKDPATQLSNVLLRFDRPPELRGAAVLVLGREPENDMFMYLPELGKVRRITQQMMSGSMLGTDFSYEDFARLQGMISDLESERLADEEVAGRTVYVTNARPLSGGDYERIRSLIDQQTCVPLRVEFYEADAEEPVKVLTIDPAKLSEEKSGWIPREIQLEDLRSGSSTRLVIEKLEVGIPIDRKCFTAAELERQGC